MIILGKNLSKKILFILTLTSMKHFIFILQTTVICLLISSVIGFLVGFIYEIGRDSHAHQMVPIWFVTLTIAACASLLSGVITGSILSALDKNNLLHAVLYAVVFAIVIAPLGWFLMGIL
jgi:Na+/H+-dicarboxylate symporter